MKIDLDAVDTSLLPEGEYHAVIADATDKVSASGNEMVVVDVLVKGGQWDGAEVRDYIVPSSAKWGLPKMRVLLDVVGISTQGGEVEFEVAQLIDKRVDIIVRHELDNRDNSTMRPRIVGYLKPVGSDVPASPDPLGNGIPATTATESAPF